MDLRETVRDIAQKVPVASAIFNHWGHQEHGPLTGAGVSALNVLVNGAIAADQAIIDAKLAGVGALVDISTSVERGEELVKHLMAEFWRRYIEKFDSEDPAVRNRNYELEDFMRKYVNPEEWTAALRFVQSIAESAGISDPEAFLFQFLKSAVSSTPLEQEASVCSRVLRAFINGDVVSSLE